MVNDVFLSSLVPHMYKSEFDDRAADFFSHYCKEALEKPMPVPIEDIAREQLHLTILEIHLSEDLSILGQTCFTDVLAEIYDLENDEYREIPVKARTVLIDPDTFLKRNFGTKRNTIAHECVHWVYHRKYYVAANRLSNQQTVAYREPAGIGDDTFSKKLIDEGWMEWQANNINPRILMPKQTVGEAFQMVLDLSKQNPSVSASLIQKGKWVILQDSVRFPSSPLQYAYRS
mgnify:CR=1 FL=1